MADEHGLQTLDDGRWVPHGAIRVWVPNGYTLAEHTTRRGLYRALVAERCTTTHLWWPAPGFEPDTPETCARRLAAALAEADQHDVQPTTGAAA